MDPIRSAEKSRPRRRRVPQDYKFEDLKSHSDYLEEKSSPSHLGSVRNYPEGEVNPKHWAIVSEGNRDATELQNAYFELNSCFPPGVTVDELKKYGRRKQLTHLRPQDNLRLEEGSLRPYKSEYKRRFLAYSLPKVVLPSEEKKVPDDCDSSLSYSLREPLLRPPNNLFVLKDHPMETITEKNSKYVPFPHYEKRKLLRRSTALKPEGEIATETEVRKEYIDHKNPEKVRLIRNLPSLRLEGEFEPLTTEQRDKFISYLLNRRPILEKKKTSLKMEGNFDFATEKTRSYVPHEFSARPRLRKRSTSLKLEGEVEFFPEYRASYVDFPRSRPVTYKPLGKIHNDGGLENLTETKTQFVNYENVEIPGSAKPENNLHVEGEMEMKPEYRYNFVDFPRERPIIRRPFNQLKPEGNLELLQEGLGVGRQTDGQTDRQTDDIQRAVELNFDRDVSYLSEKPEQIGDKIPEEDGNKKQEEQKDVMLEPEKDRLEVDGEERRPWKVEREFIFCPEFKKRYTGNTSEVNNMKEVKSYSPRKKLQRDKLKFDEKKKTGSGSLEGKSTVKRLREAASEKIQPEKEKSKEFQDRESLRYAEVSPKNTPTKEFPAFKVLDVKGQLGCQSLAKDVAECDKSTSDEENSTYRLEVFNTGRRSPGFFRNNRRVFPALALDREQLEEAEARARQRAAGNYTKIVKSPEIPNCLLEGGERDVENRWKIPEKLCPLSPEGNANERSFVVLEKKELEPLRTLREINRKDHEGWMLRAYDSPPL